MTVKRLIIDVKNKTISEKDIEVTATTKPSKVTVVNINKLVDVLKAKGIITDEDDIYDVIE